MIIVSYDIHNDKLRTQLSKLLEKYGYRLQYSLFKIKNSKRILGLIEAEIKHRFEKRFSNTDSVMIFKYSKSSADKIIKFGFAKNEDDDIIFA
jgi:CRISPR-associated protein Cas2